MSLILLLAAMAAAKEPSPEAQAAACAWQKAAASSETLVSRAQFDKRYVYDAEGSPTVGPLMRVRAACSEQVKQINTISSFSSAFDTRKFLKLLKETRPKAPAADLFDLPVTRCEIRFTDAEKSGKPAAVIWSYGEGDKRRELSSSYETFGHTITTEELAVLSTDKDPSAIFKRLEQAERVRVATVADGKAAGKPYAVHFERGARTCQRVNSDGSYTNA